jgi:TonB family protein
MRIAAQLALTFLLNASWQVALIVCFAALCDWLLRGMAARFRHVLWISTLALSLFLPALTSSRLIAASLIQKPTSVEISSEPTVVSTILSADVEAIESPAPPTRVATQSPRRNFWSSPFPVNQKLAAVLVGLYALFLAYRGANFLRAWRRTRTIVRSAHELQFPEPARTIIQQCQATIGVSHVRIFCSAFVPVPITVGVLHPLIILPEQLLHEVDREVLTSAVGHELVHVARQDYLANLIYEFIYLPLSFHPAAALVRRRIKQTREICCDESVATKLLKAEVYARSLVRLIGSVPLRSRLAANTTIGITESDNLEVRIMSLLRTPKFTPRRKTLLSITALLVLAVPCLAATSFALALDIERQEPSSGSAPQSGQQIERRNQEREREELRSAARELERQMKVASKSQRAEIEASLREVQRALELHERTLQQSARQKQKLDQEKKLAQERLAQLLRDYPADEARLKEAREKIAEMERQTPDLEARRREVQESIAEMQKSQSDRKAKVIYKVEPSYTEEARNKKIEGSVLLGLTIDHEGLPQNIHIKRSLEPSLDQAAIDAVRQWRFLPAIKDGQPVSMVITVEVNFTVEDKRLNQEQKEREEREKVEKEKAEGKGEGKGEGNGSGPLEMKRRKGAEDQGREERARKQAALTRDATIPMDRAIQIATSQVPGKVLGCSLGRDGDMVFYHLVIINTEGEKSTTTYVWLSAIDGHIIKTEKEKE